MKKLKEIGLLVAVICLVSSCSKICSYDDFTYVDEERYVEMTTMDLSIHYRVIGKGPIDVVFIPGWTNPLDVYKMQFDYFRDKARCIYIDLPGQGLSDAPEGVDYTMDMMADAVYDVLKKEKVKRFMGVGFSMGPVVLGQFYKKYPAMLAKVVNIDGGFSPWPTEEPARQGYIDGLTGFCQYIETWGEADKEAFASQLVTPDSPQEVKEFVEYFYTFPSWLMANIYWNYSLEEPNTPPGWTMPALCIFTHPVNMDNVQLRFPDTDVHIFEGSGHVVQWERHEQVNPILWDFISEDLPAKILN